MASESIKVAFLFNHDQAHQIAHALPTAIALMELAPNLDIVIATTNDIITKEIRRLAEKLHKPDINIVELKTVSPMTRLAAYTFEKFLPVKKLGIYKDNLDFFRSLDILVVSEKTSLILKSRYHLDHLKIIHTRHGAGDRAVGFDKMSALFDHVLVSGSKIRDRLIKDAAVNPDKISIIGYPKFSLLPEKPRLLPMQANGRPTVLYNPHPAPHLSSWYEDGRKILDYFYKSDRYNLIFAPHVMLFHRPFVLTIDQLRLRKPGKIAQKYWDAPNIHIDLGSAASNDMTYTMAADIYLGDVSSQIYEFLYYPRPSLFMNSHNVEWQNDPNYLHWKTGDVLSDIDNLDQALAKSGQRHMDIYKPVQEALFNQSFDLSDEKSEKRAAQAILKIVDEIKRG
ncbi:uncharacterized protein ZMO1_ZMO1734 [Zymomonas mobilis subsp. mobilis ZM4 = ATCC 31821]|uniref:CDP-glycerol:poly(Glycerophosphate) glycerophosphotransferase n=1 Tax=Zymomonas mobilis subsp. mobilis (strain ATCC 31821 / ZM4 / CP4) TaxID=264203 RepID=Q5NLQ2_ZYMMO|nr:hypothetical protein [Zymomonas mobilis]AAV90358.1 conserved hypothetical protein [Zymomonas mobilis subsp. mobilis ZM4 = ATCC 31821]AHB10711.1 hypothetical protein ZCP4_1430 [Zymomonas mobilis subsp. mobilis str. CP4 = NRRL B-14023]AHJ71023.1 hypothetical protein A254_01428 [Zymomonas mobilis subsp. mobilis NRRL B-12526]AHJ72876.1 hypothetical protein A265_01429 [Zymomonas mobilis subsp. mobilis str. CP4 = NRRL B-14023]AVZ26551.1 hypothetical protein ZMO2_ZMO1734 [Zymomonas mobilis subsp. 